LESLCCEKRGEISGLKIIEVKEFFSTLLKIESENFYKTSSYDWWNRHV